MTGDPHDRDRLWVAALAVARTRGTFGIAEVLEAAELPATARPAAREVLRAMASYGFVERTAAGEAWRAGASGPVSDPDPAGFDGTFTYLAAPTNRPTFAPETVREWLRPRLEGRVLNLFAGETRLPHDGEVVRNDLDEGIEADHHFDAAEVADHFEPRSFDTVVLDPPLSGRGGPGGRGVATGVDLDRVKNGVVGLVSIGGRTVTVGRSSTGMGTTRGFETEELCLINHPGGFADTIAVVERRVRSVIE